MTNYGVNILYRNNGDGTFTHVTEQPGSMRGLWTAAAFFDIDNDGDEDLFLGHFVEYNKQLEREYTQKGVPHYCYPLTYDPFPSRMYRNDGDGTFTDISAILESAANWVKPLVSRRTSTTTDCSICSSLTIGSQFPLPQPW